MSIINTYTQPHLIARPRRYRLGDLGISPATPFIDNWVGRIGSFSGSIPSIKTILCNTDLVNGLIVDGVWEKLIMVQTYPPDGLTTLSYPLKCQVAFPVWNSAGGILPGQLGVNGLALDGSSQNYYPGFNPGTDFPSAQSCSMIVYHHTTTNTGYACGSYGANGFIVAASFTSGGGNNYWSYCGAVSPANNLISGPTPGPGYYCHTRISATDHRIFFANSGSPHAQLGATDSTSFTGSFQQQFSAVHAIVNFPNITQLYTADQLSFVAYGLGLTQADSLALYTRVQAYRQSIGGGFV